MITDEAGRKYTPKQVAVRLARCSLNFAEVVNEMPMYANYTEKDVELIEQQYSKLIDRIEKKCLSIRMP